MVFTIISKKPVLVENGKGNLVNIYVNGKVEKINKTVNLPTKYDFFTYGEIIAKFNITKEKPFVIEEIKPNASEEKTQETQEKEESEKTETSEEKEESKEKNKK